MIYTQKEFGYKLKELVVAEASLEEIGQWAYRVYLELDVNSSREFLQLLLDLNTLELGPEFFISYDMLNKIADDLIAGKSVDLNSDEYREDIN